MEGAGQVSGAAAAWAWRQALAPTPRVVLCVLAGRVNAQGQCTPRVIEIAALSYISRRAARDALAVLEQQGFIKKSGKNGTITTYSLNMHLTKPGQNPPRLKARNGHATGADLAHDRGGFATGAKSAPLDSHAPADIVPKLPPSTAPGERVPDDLDSVQRARVARCAKPAEKPAPDFEAFWLAYPRKVGKHDARRAWARAAKQASAAAVMAGLARHQFNPDPRYVPHPATWLNGGRWQDEQPSDLYASARGKPAGPVKTRREVQHERIMAMVNGDEEARH